MLSAPASGTPRRLKEMTADRIAATLMDDPRLIFPIGTCGRYPDTLPAGCATTIVERLADDLSAEFGVLRAPTFEYGVNPPTSGRTLGAVSLHKKTLHRALNDMLASWEANGVAEFIMLTAHGYDPYLEALSTVNTVTARVRVVDIFEVNLADLIDYARAPESDRTAVYQSLLQHVAPAQLSGATVSDDGARQGAQIYERIRTRVSERIFLAPVPTE